MVHSIIVIGFHTGIARVEEGGGMNNNTTLPWLTISYLNIWSLYLALSDHWLLAAGMYFQIFSYCLTISQWCKSVFRVVVVSLYFICNRNSNRPALLTLLTRLGHGWLRWGGAGRVRAGRGVRMLQCYREMAARARSPDISGDQWPGEGSVTSGLNRVSTCLCCLCHCVMFRTRPGITQAV